MVEEIPSHSAALGFWVKHQDAMEAYVYDSDGDSVPAELKETFEDERFRSLLNLIEEASDSDANALVHAIANATAQEWSKHPSVVIDRKRKASEWSEKFHLRRKRSRSGNFIEVGFYMETNPHLGPTLYVFLWTKGGKAAAESNAQCIRDVAKHHVLKGADDRTRYWANGIILLARIPLTGFMSPEEAFEPRRFYDHAVAEVTKCSSDAVARILETRG